MDGKLGHVSVEILFQDLAEQLGLQWVAGRAGGHRSLSFEALHKPPPALIGHLNFAHPNRVQVLDCAEVDYLRGLSGSRLQEAIDQLFSNAPAAIVISDGETVPAVLCETAERTGTPLFSSTLASTILMSYLGHYLTQSLAETTSQHGVFLEVLGMGVLIKGDAGVGKSELALELVTRGHRLVADDEAMAEPQPNVWNLASTIRSFLSSSLMNSFNASPQARLPTSPTESASAISPTFLGLRKCSLTLSV